MQRTTLAAAVAEYAEREPAGEYVLIIAGAAVNDATAQMSLEQAAALVRRLAREGQSLSDAAKQVANETGYRKGDLYRLALESERSRTSIYYLSSYKSPLLLFEAGPSLFLVCLH